jgi:hypothetical protein
MAVRENSEPVLNAGLRRMRTLNGTSQQERPMEPISEALQLLQREADIQHGQRRSRDNPLLAERELCLIRQRLDRYPAALQAIAFAASELHRPVDTLSVRDVEMRC